jgi:flagellar basal-body rod protein FlgF
MVYGLYVSAAGAESQNRRIQALSHNLANVDTPGFKRELAIVQARHTEAIERGLDHIGSRSQNDIGGGAEIGETVSDFSRGALKLTGIASDLALEAQDSFFVVQRDGRELLTRAGNFTTASNGMLQTQDGYPVLGEGGPILVNPNLPWQIQDDGVVVQNNTAIARLRVVRPQSLGDLSKAGGNLFQPLAPVVTASLAQRRMRSGYLEMSTVQPAAEMMELIEASRAYEANVRMIQNHDQMVGALVNRVLRQS